MFFERAQLHCAVILGGGALLCNFMCSSPIFFLAAHAMPLIRWNLRTEALEEEDLPLLQGVTFAGHTCDLGLSAFADDFAKKIVARSEKELFEALKHSHEVLDEELARGGWKRNVDKREVVPTMKAERPGFDLVGNGHASLLELDTWADGSRGMATIGRNCSAERGRFALHGCLWADSGR